MNALIVVYGRASQPPAVCSVIVTNNTKHQRQVLIQQEYYNIGNLKDKPLLFLVKINDDDASELTSFKKKKNSQIPFCYITLLEKLHEIAEGTNKYEDLPKVFSLMVFLASYTKFVIFVCLKYLIGFQIKSSLKSVYYQNGNCQKHECTHV